MSTSSDRPNTKLTVRCKDTIKTHVERRLRDLKKGNVFPIDPADYENLYFSVVEPSVREHVYRLWKNTGAQGYNFLRYTNAANLRIEHPTDDTMYVKTELRFPKSVPELYDHRDAKLVPTITRCHPEYLPLVKWAIKARTIDRNTLQTNNLVTELVGYCSTYGQLIRLWPELIDYFPDKQRVAGANGQIRRSQLPWQISQSLMKYKAEINIATEVLAYAVLCSAIPSNNRALIWVHSSY